MARPMRSPLQPSPTGRCRKASAFLPAALSAACWNSRGLAWGPGASSDKLCLAVSPAPVATWRWFESGAGDDGPGPRAYCRRWYLHLHPAIHRSFPSATPHAPVRTGIWGHRCHVKRYNFAYPIIINQTGYQTILSQSNQWEHTEFRAYIYPYSSSHWLSVPHSWIHVKVLG